MSEMIEKVARAIAENQGSNWDTCLDAPGRKMAGMYRSIARAAIEAMLEPTEKMLDILAYNLMIDDEYGIWKDLIDAALEEKE